MPVKGSEPREFFVWVNPNEPSVQHNMGLIGAFTGGPTTGLGGGSPEYLQFVHNPEAPPSAVSPFHNNVISRYRVEYNLENFRHGHQVFRHYPSRLWALFLLESREAANSYAIAHPDHVLGRTLKRCVTTGQYSYSKHDAAWVDFLRIDHMIDPETYSFCMNGYWSAERADQVEWTSMGKPWRPISVTEVLFYVTVEFPNKAPAVPD